MTKFAALGRAPLRDEANLSVVNLSPGNAVVPRSVKDSLHLDHRYRDQGSLHGVKLHSRVSGRCVSV